MSSIEINSNVLTNIKQVTKFNTPQEEIDYLKSKLSETQAEFNEFQESSHELEVEYEAQVKELEKNNQDQLNRISRLERENDQLKSKYNAYANSTQSKLNEYQEQIAQLTALNQRLTSCIRELEQSNDDLERAQRTLAASLEDFEAQLNQQIEKNVLLENEISDKGDLECVVQRLKEETRDLRHELIASGSINDPTKRKMPLSNVASTKVEENDESEQKAGSSSGKIRMKRSTTSDSSTSPIHTSASRFSFSSPFSSNGNKSSKATDSKSQQTSNPSSPTALPQSIVMSPSSRISALNIVSDLLRKVGVLESKLASAKKVAN